MSSVRCLRALVAALLLVGAVLAPSLPDLSPLEALEAHEAQAQHGAQTGTADVLIDFGDGRTVFHRAPVDGGSTGVDLLMGSGAEVVLNAGAVCSINGTGCPVNDCFCGCSGPGDCRWWAYFHGRPDGGWDEAQAGPDEHSVTAGSIDGWTWSPGSDRPPITATTELRAVLAGFDWLHGRQEPNASLADAAGLTAELVLAARASGTYYGFGPDGRDPVDFLQPAAAAYAARGPAHAGKLAVAASAAGRNPRAFGGVDLVGRLMSDYDAETGRFGGSNWDQAWAMLGLVAAGESVPSDALVELVGSQGNQGGWSVAPGGLPDPDSTALAIQALSAAGATAASPPILKGHDYLARTQVDDGGWSHLDGPPSANSTAYVVQGLVGTGQDPRQERWVKGSADPIGFLVSRQRPDGRFEHDTSPADLISTLQVLPALSGRSFPLVGRYVAANRGADWVLRQQRPDGSFDDSGPGAAIDAALALAAVGRSPDARAPSGSSVSEYLAAQAADYAGRGASAAGKLAVGAHALGAEPQDFGGVDAVAVIRGTFDAGTGAYGAGGIWDSAWAMLGLVASGETVPASAVRYLLAAASEAGGWGFSANADEADADSTGLALQALAAAGADADEPAVWRGVDRLRRLQNDDGGFAGFGGATSANSTGLAVGGLVAYGHEVEGTGWMRAPAGRLTLSGPLDWLIGQQSPVGGFEGAGSPNNASATHAAVLALARQPMPVSAPVIGIAVYLPFTTNRR